MRRTARRTVLLRPKRYPKGKPLKRATRRKARSAGTQSAHPNHWTSELSSPVARMGRPCSNKRSIQRKKHPHSFKEHKAPHCSKHFTAPTSHGYHRADASTSTLRPRAMLFLRYTVGSLIIVAVGQTCWVVEVHSLGIQVLQQYLPCSNDELCYGTRKQGPRRSALVVYVVRVG